MKHVEDFLTYTIKYRVKDAVKNAKNFYIGKTGKSVIQKYEDDYKDKYENIESLFSSEEESEIEALEDKMHQYFLNHTYYKNRYNNKNEGSAGDMKDEGSIYSLYLVWNPE